MTSAPPRDVNIERVFQGGCFASEMNSDESDYDSDDESENEETLGSDKRRLCLLFDAEPMAEATAESTESQPASQPAPQPAQFHVKRRARERVLILGAGLAGLACATRLKKAGCRVKLLEAKPRVGGRCLTETLGGVVRVDLGASWVHGLRKNPLGMLATSAGAHLVDTGEDVGLRCGRTGRVLAKTAQDTEAERRFNAALGSARARGDAAAQQAASDELGALKPSAVPKACARHGAGFSLGEGFAAALLTGGSGGPQAASTEDVASAGADVGGLIRWHVANLEYANACSLDALSLRHWDQDDANSFEGSHCVCREGLGGLVAETMAKKLGPESLQLGFVVARVERKPTGGFCVVSRAGERVDCEAVVMTLPLGVLKSGSVRFTPELPAFKMDVVQRMGFGVLNKVAFLFTRAFWREERFWSNGAPITSQNLGRVSVQDEENSSDLFMWVDLETALGEAVLCALVPAAAAERLEESEPVGPEATRQPSPQLTAKCLKALCSLLGGQEADEALFATYLVDAKFTAWRHDEFARGSYSYLAPGCVPRDVDAMAAPLDDGRLRFAGEATSRAHLATAAGALDSGEREARALMAVLGLDEPRLQKKRELLGQPTEACYDEHESPQTRCSLCGSLAAEDASTPGFHPGDMLAFKFADGTSHWVHDGCAAYSPEVSVLDETWYNVEAAVRRGRQLRCADCNQWGATIGCAKKTCRHSYHPRCAAKATNWDFGTSRPRLPPRLAPAPPTEDDRELSADDSADEQQAPVLPFVCPEHRDPSDRPHRKLQRPRHAASRKRPAKRPSGVGRDPQEQEPQTATEPAPKFGKPAHVLLRSTQ